MVTDVTWFLNTATKVSLQSISALYPAIAGRNNEKEALILTGIYMPVSGSGTFIKNSNAVSKLTIGNISACSDAQDNYEKTDLIRLV